MARSSSPLHTTRPSLVRLALDILMSVVAVLRGRWERELVRPFLHADHRTRITREKFLAMMDAMLRDDARLRREIFEAAMRMLGRDVPRLPDGAFALPKPKSARGLSRRWCDYARMVNYSAWCAHRLARRLTRLGCDALRFGQSAPSLVTCDEAACVKRSCAALDQNGARDACLARARAPPPVLIASSAPCKPRLARSLAFA